MCGIIGYIGKKRAAEVLLHGLRRLEYRGYDSAGICVREKGALHVIRKRGRIAELAARPEIEKLSGASGIGHTRWATHGAPSELNAHPHSDCSGKIAIVHNGIIENADTLRALLSREGHKFASETDSEVAAHLIEKFYEGNLEEALLKALALVQGAFGLAAMHSDEDCIAAARRGSPLILGVGRGEMLVASDVSAVLRHTKRVIYLKDNELALIKSGKYAVRKLNGEIVRDPAVHRIRWSAELMEKGGFRHYMQKEIWEQPQALLGALRGRLRGGRVKLSVAADAAAIRRVIFIACGTSYYSSLLGKYAIERLAGIPTEVDYASEFRYRHPAVGPRDLVVAVSQSGETADTLAAIAEAKERGATTLGIVNVAGSSIAREVHSGIYLHAGPEIGVASTKAFSNQVVCILLLALWLAERRGQRPPRDLLYALRALPEQAELALKTSSQARAAAEQFQKYKNALFLGRGTSFPAALEGALKLKEISYIHAEGYPAAEMKHGPIALIDEQIFSVCLAPRDSLYDKMLSSMEEVRARGGTMIAVTTKKDEKIRRLARAVITVPESHELTQPILSVIPLQLFAYHMAALKGLDMDKPRNLAKSVTVE